MDPISPSPHISPPKTVSRQDLPPLAPCERCLSKSTPNRVSPIYTQCLANLYRYRSNKKFFKQVKASAKPRVLKWRKKKKGRKWNMHLRQLGVEEAALRKAYTSSGTDDLVSGPMVRLRSERHSVWVERGILTDQTLEPQRKSRPDYSQAHVLEMEGSTISKAILAQEGIRPSSLLEEKREKLVMELLDKKSRFSTRHKRLSALCEVAGTGHHCIELVLDFEDNQERERRKKKRGWRMGPQLDSGSGMQEIMRMTQEIGQTVYDVLDPMYWIQKDLEDGSKIDIILEQDEESSLI